MKISQLKMVTTRQMIRNNGFTSKDGKEFIKILGKGYVLKAIQKKINNVKHVIVSKYHAGNLIEEKSFMEDVDYDTMTRYCNIQSF